MNAAHHKSRLMRGGGLKTLAAAALGAVVALSLAFAPAVAFAASGYDSVTVEIPVTVEATGDASDDVQTFTFVIEPADGEEAAPDQSEVSIEGAGDATFTLSFHNVGSSPLRSQSGGGECRRMEL